MTTHLVFRLRNEPVPKKITRGSVYAVVTRKSILGFHKYPNSPNFDPSCTKTELILFEKEFHAKNISAVLEKSYMNIVRFSREITYEDKSISVISDSLNFDIHPDEPADSFKPIDIELIPFDHLEKLCMIHYFDMLVAYEIDIQNGQNIYLDCYRYNTYELPNRTIQEKIFRDMLYRNY